MPLKWGDRVKDTTATGGLGPKTLDEATPPGFQLFADVLSDGDTCYATISMDNGEWEVGLYQYSTTGPTLTTLRIISSSLGGVAVDFDAGPKTVILDLPSSVAADIMSLGEQLALVNNLPLP